MTGDAAPDAFADALLAARLCAHDPRLGGIVLRGGGDLRDAVLAELRAALPANAPVRRIPPHADAETLLGGLDLAATLGLGRPVTRAGLLAAAAGGVVVLPIAERLPDALATMIADAGVLVLALDDGVDDERPPAALLERLAFHIDLSRFPSSQRKLGSRAASAEQEPHETPAYAGVTDFGPDRSAAPRDEVSPLETLHALAATAQALGIASARAPHFALRVARAAAALVGRDPVAESDLILATRLVLAPRATRVPAPAESPPEAPPPDTDTPATEDQTTPQPLDDLVLAAALASLPKDLLARLAATPRRGPASRTRGAGERRRSAHRGRPLGARPGIPRGGLRLSLIDTLRAAAPWQKLRARDGRVRLRRDDLRVRRFETRAEATTIFAVDASGSSALARLAEAKGAVELLLAEAYVKRAQVALVAFRGEKAELLLPPTRSLARARRMLADLPGGGGTPLAAGLDAARALAEAARSRGRTPFLVVLTDGRANVATDGGTARQAAEADATAAARAIGMSGIASVFVDISPRPRPEGTRLALAMRARYLPLPRADAAAMHAAVSAAQPA